MKFRGLAWSYCKKNPVECDVMGGWEVSRVVLLALLEDALLAWVMVGEVDVGDGWMVTQGCRRLAFHGRAETAAEYQGGRSACSALRSTELSDTAAQQGSQ